MVSLIVHAVLGVATTAFVAWRNRHLFTGGWDGRRVQPLEGVFCLVGVVSVGLGWYFNIRYVQEFGSARELDPLHESSVFRQLGRQFPAAQDYIIANVSSSPLDDHRRPPTRHPRCRGASSS